MKNKNEWAKIANQIDSQTQKEKRYDNVLIGLLRNIKGKKVLDYGCGTGEIARRVREKKAIVKGYDLSKEMRHLAREKLGKKTVYSRISDIPSKFFDIILSNLVICIVSEAEMKRILERTHNFLVKNGEAYIGFCNPLAFNIKENSFQKRFVRNLPYEKKHSYKKLIKEGNFKITEQHRPLEFYEKSFLESGFTIENKRISQSQDFIIYWLRKM